MKSYLARFIAHQEQAEAGQSLLQCIEGYCVLQAPDNLVAFEGASLVAAAAVSRLRSESLDVIFDGLSDLLMTIEEPASLAELTWKQSEVPLSQLADLRSRFVREGESCANSSSGWYVADLLYEEVHDTGTHGNSVLLWTNSHLIEATDAISAFAEARRLGLERAREMGTHSCDDDIAHWVFQGLSRVRPTLERPRNGAVLWIEEFEASADELKFMISKRDDLSVFRVWGQRETG